MVTSTQSRGRTALLRESLFFNGLLDREITQADGLREIRDLYYRLDEPRELIDFCMLSWALDDLCIAEHQWYWPGADRTNIESIIDRRCAEWLVDPSSGPA